MAARLKQLVLDRIDLVDAPANPGSRVVLIKRDAKAKSGGPGVGAVHVPQADLDKVAPTKTDGGQNYPAAAYAYVPDPKSPSTWKLRLWESPTAKESAAQVGRAVAALGAGFRGEKVQIPAGDLAAVKSKVLAAWRKCNPDAGAGDEPSVLKRSGTVMAKTRKNLTFGQRLAKAFDDVFKAGEPGADVADWAEGGGEPGAEGEPGGEPAPKAPVKESAALTSMKVHHADLGKAIDGMGDASKLPADHPVHALKAMHTALGNDIAAKVAEEAAAATPAPEPVAEGEPGVEMSVTEPYGPQTGEPGVGKMLKNLMRGVDKRYDVLKGELAKANKRATDAEAIAKSERDARALDGVKVELRKFDKLSIDVDKEAPKYLLMKQASESVYQSTIETLKAAQAQIAKADSLMVEIGAAGDGMVGGSGEKAAWAAIEAEAEKLIGVRKSASGKPLSKQQASAIVLEGKTPEHKRLMKAYYDAKGTGSATQ